MKITEKNKDYNGYHIILIKINKNGYINFIMKQMMILLLK